MATPTALLQALAEGSPGVVPCWEMPRPATSPPRASFSWRQRPALPRGWPHAPFSLAQRTGVEVRPCYRMGAESLGTGLAPQPPYLHLLTLEALWASAC